jgi:acetoin utilization protein AcuB
MIVRMWMTEDVLTIAPDTPAREAAKTMARRGIRRLPVVTDGRGDLRLVGIVSAHDILHAFPSDVNPFCVADSRIDADRVTVSEIMSSPVLTTHPNMPLEEVARTLLDRRVGALPVVKELQLIGIITESDVFRAFTSSLAFTQNGVRITFDVSEDEDVAYFVVNAARSHGLRVANVVTCRWQDRRMAVVGIFGDRTDRFVDEIWTSGHTVLSVAEVTPNEPEDLPLKQVRARRLVSS